MYNHALLLAIQLGNFIFRTVINSSFMEILPEWWAEYHKNFHS